jgi:hypothetical protein
MYARGETDLFQPRLFSGLLFMRLLRLSVERLGGELCNTVIRCKHSEGYVGAP